MHEGSKSRGRRTRWIAGLGAVAVLGAVVLLVAFGDWAGGEQDAALERESLSATRAGGGLEDDLANADAGAAAKASNADAGAAAVMPPGAAARASSNAGVYARLGWGAGKDQVGRERPEEANPEGPMSLTIDANGRALLLDQVNGRILQLDADGKPLSEFPLPVRAAQDVAVAGDGSMAVLDRLADRTVAILDENGKLKGELPVVGRGVEEGGGVTGVFVDGEDVYVEREHGPLVKVGDTNGTPDPERPEIPGRPSRDGKYFLNAGLIDALAGRLYVNALSRPEQNHLYTRELQMGAPLLGILALDTDLNGVIYLALLAELPQTTAEAPPTFSVRLLCLNAADGTPLGQAELPATTLPEESFRDFAIKNEGGVIYAYRTEEGVEYRHADCR